MEIIQTLRNNSTPDVAEQLFKTLTETSLEIEKSQEVPQEEVKEDDAEADTSNKKVLDIEDQLKLLLNKLNSNSKLKQNTSYPQREGGKKRDGNQAPNLQAAGGSAQGSSTTGST